MYFSFPASFLSFSERLLLVVLEHVGNGLRAKS